jgi:hypothetical protein
LTILKSFSLVFISLILIGQSFAVMDEDSVAGVWLLDEGGGGTVGDNSGNGNDGSIISEPEWTDGKFGKALEFDGEDDMVDTPYVSDDQSEAFTINMQRKEGFFSA